MFFCFLLLLCFEISCSTNFLIGGREIFENGRSFWRMWPWMLVRTWQHCPLQRTVYAETQRRWVPYVLVWFPPLLLRRLVSFLALSYGAYLHLAPSPTVLNFTARHLLWCLVSLSIFSYSAHLHSAHSLTALKEWRRRGKKIRSCRPYLGPAADGTSHRRGGGAHHGPVLVTEQQQPQQPQVALQSPCLPLFSIHILYICIAIINLCYRVGTHQAGTHCPRSVGYN